MTGTTSFLVSFVLLLFNPLNDGEIMYFPGLYDLCDWLWWSWCLVLNFLVFFFQRFSIFGGVRSLRLDVLVA